MRFFGPQATALFEKVTDLVLKIIHLMRDGSGKVACLESNHFVGSSPTGGDIFFLKSDLNWPYFTISNILESLIKISEVRETSKLKKLYKK